MRTNDIWKLVKVSSMSLEDSFIKRYRPKTEREQKLKAELKIIIREKKVKDFERPKIDPSLTPNLHNICFVEGRKPAVGKSYIWWKNIAKAYDDEGRTRLGTKSEYIAFLGVLIKTLVEEEEWSVEEAWDAVCNNSVKLGNYLNSVNAKHVFEPTGSRSVCGFCDLSNAYKVLAPDDNGSGYWLASGYYLITGSHLPLSDCSRGVNIEHALDLSTGWIIREC